MDIFDEMTNDLKQNEDLSKMIILKKEVDSIKIIFINELENYAIFQEWITKWMIKDVSQIALTISFKKRSQKLFSRLLL